MALLSKADREKRFKYLGYDGYNKDNILKFQKKAFPNNKEQQDGKYGINTDRALRHFYNVKKCAPSFAPTEFRCNCGHCTGYPSYMKQVELKHLQKIRDHYGKPMTITSGLRCEYENTRSGGVKNSGHLRGYASDIYMKGVTDTVANRQKALKYFKSLPNHEFSYGAHMKDSNGLYRTADGMGNAMHTETHKPKEVVKVVSPIGECANKYAWGIDDADKAKYPSGSPKPAYKKALAKVYPNHNKWGTAPSKGASCDVFVGTCVRSAGIDKNFPRGLDEQIDYLPKSPKFKSVSVTTKTVQDGDIIVYAKKGGGAHICIAYGGKTKEAGYEHYYPKTTDYLEQRLSKSGKKWLKVYRAK